MSLVAAVRKHMFDEGEQTARLFDQVRGGVPILDICGDRLDPKKQAYCIDKRVAFDAFDFFARIVANRIPAAAPFSGGLDRLGIDDCGARRSLAAFRFAASHQEFMMDAVENAVARPFPEIGVNRRTRREILGQVPTTDGLCAKHSAPRS